MIIRSKMNNSSNNFLNSSNNIEELILSDLLIRKNNVDRLVGNVNKANRYVKFDWTGIEDSKADVIGLLYIDCGNILSELQIESQQRWDAKYGQPIAVQKLKETQSTIDCICEEMMINANAVGKPALKMFMNNNGWAKKYFCRTLYMCSLYVEDNNGPMSEWFYKHGKLNELDSAAETTSVGMRDLMNQTDVTSELHRDGYFENMDKLSLY